MTRVFLVTGAQRTGSTLLATALGMVPGAAVVGELRLLWPSLVERRPCACLVAAPDCPVWSTVVDRVLAAPGVQGCTVNDLARMNATALRQRDLPTFLARHLPTDLAPLAAATLALYEALADVHGAQVLVDSSKSPAWFAFVRLIAHRDDHDRDALDVRGVHLVRDPRGVVDSWSVDKLWRRDGWSEELLAKPAGRAVREWVAMNAGAELARVGPRVRFEDFTADPEPVMRRLIDLAGLEQPTAERLPIHDGAVMVAPNHAIGGNVDRFDTGPVPLRASAGWKTRVDPAVQRRLRPLARLYGYR